MIDLKRETYFPCELFITEKPEWVNNLNQLCDPYMEESKKRNKHYLLERDKKFRAKLKDKGMMFHSSPLQGDKNFNFFTKYIAHQSFNILKDQGYAVENYNMAVNELWAQEFGKSGAGYHSAHVHPNNHISGFYYLKCTDRTSMPIFHDPRPGKAIIDLPEKNPEKITPASSRFYYQPTPGTLIFFNSYMTHEYGLDLGLDPFRFIHFNIQAVRPNA